MERISKIFGSLVFNDNVMKERLPKDIYDVLKNTIHQGKPIDIKIANVVANTMKDWAIENGATHFTHWFQPMTGITAEKHDSFISPTNDGNVIMEFSGKELIKGEPDGSSFPSGGLRSTFEARGYTVWDPTSYAFIRDTTLCIPTAFCSYSGQSLDKKTPLLKSMAALDKTAVRLLNILGYDDVTRVITTVGPEQEYFLIDKNLYEKRMDLKFCQRTLFGAKPPKGQEMEDHYFGSIKPRVAEFMKELDMELWKLGVLSKTKHNEVAPSQHELAPVHTVTNVATDHNQITMDLMKRIADKHGLVCLLHEKPFAGVNGSGKHNNWSMTTNKGKNLLDPGKKPFENKTFLLFLSAIIKAVDEYQDLLRLSVASAGNDHRLGGNEAPPAIISMFIGSDLKKILKCIENDLPYTEEVLNRMDIDVDVLPSFMKDTTDRNRTSPFAFTGNKFEFRMCPSSGSISGPNFVLNAIVAEVLSEFADRLEKAHDVEAEVNDIIIETVKKHKRIIFNGNGYSEDWIEEAARRGLPNITTTVESIKSLLDEKNIEVLEKHNVLTREEVHSRYEISLENYSKTINIEALTMIEMTKREILPAVISFAGKLAKGINEMKSTGLSLRLNCQDELLEKVCILTNSADEKVKVLENVLLKAEGIEESYEQAYAYKFEVVAAMDDLREDIDALETVVGKEYWPLPTYTDLLFSV